MQRQSNMERRDSENRRLIEEFSHGGAENVSYDYFKNMVSLSVATLGGVLGLSGGPFAERIDNPQMMVASGLIALSGLISLQCQADIMQIMRGRKQPTVWLRQGHRLVTGFFGAGVGGFLFMISGVLNG